MASTPMLNFAVLIDRPTVVIDGTAYELRAVEQFSILEYQQHMAQAGRLTSFLVRIDTFTDEEAPEFARLLEAFCQRVLAAPAAVLAALADVQRLRIVEAFFLLPELTGQIPGANLASPPATRTIGATLSPDSRVSTAALQ